jgi:hypothetical protein
MQSKYPDYASNELQVAIRDAMAEIELELELDGQTGLGNTYAPGDVYKYFAVDGESFDAYFGYTEKGGARIRILTDKNCSWTRTHVGSQVGRSRTPERRRLT